MNKITLSVGARTAIELLKNAGFEAYAVGGAVRDSLMGKTPFDFDITTSAKPEETISVFSGYRTFPQGIKHGTVSVIIEGEVLEITTYRQDGDYADHRHPDQVLFTRRLQDDLSRRDFTVNAMAYNDEEGVVDLFGGVEHLKSRTLASVGNAEERFEEDALRILRALRFSSVLDFDIDYATALAIEKKAPLLRFVSRERISVEMRKLLAGVRVERIFNEFRSVFEVLFENITLGDGRAIERCHTPLARLALFFCHSPHLLSSIVPSNKEKKTVLEAIAIYASPPCNDKRSLLGLMSEYSLDAINTFVEMMEASKKDISFVKDGVESILKDGDCYKKEMLAIGGADIVSLGVPPSKNIGLILDTIFDEVLDGKLNNERNALTKRIHEINEGLKGSD